MNKQFLDALGLINLRKILYFIWKISNCFKIFPFPIGSQYLRSSGFYAVYSCNSLPRSRNVGKELQLYDSVTSQKIPELIYFAAEDWNIPQGRSSEISVEIIQLFRGYNWYGVLF